MKESIERMGKFLLDNAGLIARELKKSSHYRSLSMSVNVFKHGKEELNAEFNLYIYDERSTSYYLYGEDINTKNFKQICAMMNRETGVARERKSKKA